MYIARQIDPENQEPPLYWDIDNMGGTYLEGFIFNGNNHYKSHKTDEYEVIEQNASDALNDIDDINIAQDNPDISSAFETKREVVEYYFGRANKYSDEEIKKFCDALYLYDNPKDEDGAMCIMLSLLTEKEYDCTCIKGCSQGDWQCLYYPVSEWSNDEIKTIECEYFNSGSEWKVAEQGQEDFENIYTHGWNDEAIQKAKVYIINVDET